MGWEVDILKV